jgi:hypothetical protein
MEPNHYYPGIFLLYKMDISSSYRTIGTDKAGVITNAYGLQALQEKGIFLDNLTHLGDLVGDRKWILGGDFNLITSLEEKHGGLMTFRQ